MTRTSSKNRLEVCLSTLLSLLVYGTMRVFLIRCTWKQVEQGKYLRDSPRISSGATEIGLKYSLQIVREQATKESRRREIVDAKIQRLFAFGALLMPVASSVALTSSQFQPIGLLAAISLMVLMTLALWHFRVGISMSPTADQHLVTIRTEREALIACVQSTKDANSHNAGVTDFHVDISRAANRVVSFSAILLAIVAIVLFFHPTTKPSTQQVIQSLRSDPDLLNLLRGPQGARGAPGGCEQHSH